jgi:small nuclear ribonucleoprotein (snRNP)-like protein
MKSYFQILFLFFLANFMFAQQPGILLEKKDSQKTIFIKENKRIKIETNNGITYSGKFKIIDQNTFSIDSISIPINSIVAIKKQSLSFLILTPIIVVTGVVLVLGGVGVSVLGGVKSVIGVGMLFSGFYVGSIPFITSNHKSNKWNYSVGEDMSIPPDSNNKLDENPK